MNPPTTYESGEVLLADFGDVISGEVKGHEQGNKRPCLVIKSTHNYGLLLVIPFTTKRPKVPTHFYWKVAKNTGGLRLDSFALCHQIRTISVERIVRKIGQLTDNEFDEILTVLSDFMSK